LLQKKQKYLFQLFIFIFAKNRKKFFFFFTLLLAGANRPEPARHPRLVPEQTLQGQEAPDPAARAAAPPRKGEWVAVSFHWT